MDTLFRARLRTTVLARRTEIDQNSLWHRAARFTGPRRMTHTRSETRPATPPATDELMSADELQKWFQTARPGEKCLYYRGNLALARAADHPVGMMALTKLVDTARRLGTPTGYLLGPSRHDRASVTEYGVGAAHLAQRRVQEDVYEYWISKSAVTVLK